MGDVGKAGAELSDTAIAWLVALDGGTADEQAFEAWRDADPRHAAAFAQVAARWRRTADPRLTVLLDHPSEAAAEPAPESAQVAPRMFSRRAVAASVAVATLGIGAAFLAWPRRAFASTGVGERRTLRLPDGSHAMLNTDTHVAWRFDDAREFWIERGEAALLVRPGEAPFRLHGDVLDAHLSSGRFDMRRETTGGRLLVLTGTAAASYGGAPAETIHAGTMLTIRGGKGRITPLSVKAIDVATAWQQGRIIFNGMRLDQAVAEFNRYLADPIMLQQPDLATTQLGGEFQIDDPDGFLLALRDGFGIDSRRQDGRILLFRSHSRPASRGER